MLVSIELNKYSNRVSELWIGEQSIGSVKSVHEFDFGYHFLPLPAPSN